ncbi:aldehyde dehydrogenase [Bartonella apis]|uniref:aldehyde dehydrogenase n=1 Tax=Bartonella apis TaxID=1686310 RepID=UPI00242B6FA0|nr:aldehyde dehydrogenase [Bartonella apis]
MENVLLFIDGKHRKANGDKTFIRKNPIDGEVVSVAAAAQIEDIVEVVDAASRAFEDWSQSTPQERQRLLQRAAEIMLAKKDDFISAMAAETGASEVWAGFNVALGAAVFQEAASIVTAATGEVLSSNTAGQLSLAVRQPAGVVVGIAPWNAPIILGSRAIAVPLACGNSVILKGSEACPLTHALIVDCLAEAGFAKGVVNYVTNAPDEAAIFVEKLVCAPDVRRVNFTGSTKVGRIIASHCARSLKPCVLELGGKAPILILEDADIEAAVDATVFGAFMNSGQICMSTERIIVVERVAAAFLGKLVERVKKLTIGDPRKDNVNLGPVYDMATVVHCNRLIDDALFKGAKLLCGGKSETTLMLATLLDDVVPSMDIYHEETFGPVKAIIRARDDEHAVSLANDSEYGLSSAIFTRDTAKGYRLAKRIKSGICHINGATVDDEPQAPFGGVKASGFGRFGGQAGIHEFTDLRWLTMETERRRYPL